VLSTLQEATFTAVHTYVLSQEGQSRISQALQRHRLPASLDSDLEEAVISEALRFITQGNEISSAAGWCNARIRARAIDLARGVIRKRPHDEQLAREANEILDDSDDHDPGTGDQHGELFPSSEPALQPLLAAWRDAVLVSDAHPLDVCAALTAISVLAEEAILAEDCPQPLAGATTEEAACWAGLWYSNRSECFGAGNTVTKRRSRAAGRIKAALRAALEGHV
jgi:hypothetical protein